MSPLRLILASTSPRRHELLSRLGFPFEVASPRFEENPTALSATEEVMYFAEEKARSLARNFPDDWILGCDTLVAVDGEKLGKPRDEVDARQTLKKLSGREHEVYSGLVLFQPKSGVLKKYLAKAVVSFRKISDEEITAYLKTGEPFGKAGSYAIQGQARKFVEQIVGEEETVIGLPLRELSGWLKILFPS